MTPSPRVLTILLGVVLVAAPLALAGEVAAVGTWDAIAETPQGDMAAVMTIVEKEGALEVEMEIGGMKRPVSNEKLEGHVITMTVRYDGTPYDVEAKIDGDEMKGTYSGSDASGTLTATRRP